MQPLPSPCCSKADETFWTLCPNCFMNFEYAKMYLGKNLRCPNCKQPYVADEVRPPPLKRYSSSKPWFSHEASGSKHQFPGGLSLNPKQDVQQASSYLKRQHDTSAKNQVKEVAAVQNKKNGPGPKPTKKKVMDSSSLELRSNLIELGRKVVRDFLMNASKSAPKEDQEKQTGAEESLEEKGAEKMEGESVNSRFRDPIVTYSRKRRGKKVAGNSKGMKN